MKSRRGRWKRIAGNIALLLASTAFICVVLEFAFRILAPQPLGLRFYSREGILLHYPNARIRYIRKGIDRIVTIDSDGLRDRQYGPGKPEGVFRILVLGDSCTEGVQVDDRDVWPKLVEDAIGRERGAGNVELVNAAVSGEGTADQLRYLQVFGNRWRADLIVLAFYCGNDVRDNLSDRRVKLESGKLEVTRRSPFSEPTYRIKKARAWLGSHSHLYQFLRDRTSPSAIWKSMLRGLRLGGAKMTETEEWEDFDDKRLIQLPQPEEIVRGWEITRALLDRMAAQTHSLSARFAVIVIPSRWMVDEEFLREKIAKNPAGGKTTYDPQLPGRTLAAWAQQRGIVLFDLTEPFREDGANGSYHFDADAHWNQVGHRAAARHIARFLLSSGIVPETRDVARSGGR